MLQDTSTLSFPKILVVLNNFWYQSKHNDRMSAFRKIFRRAMLNIFYKFVRIVYAWKVLFYMYYQDFPLFLFVILIEKCRSVYSRITGICLPYYLFFVFTIFTVEGNHFHHYVHIGITAGLLANHWCSTLSYMATNIFNILPCDSTVQPRLGNMALENPST